MCRYTAISKRQYFWLNMKQFDTLISTISFSHFNTMQLEKPAGLCNMRTLTFDSEKFRLKGLLCNVNKENWSSLLLISSALLNKPVQSLIEIYCYEQRISRPLEYAFPPLTIKETSSFETIKIWIYVIAVEPLAVRIRKLYYRCK